MRLVGGTIKRAGRIIVRKVTGRSRTAMRGEAALTVTHGCVGWGVEERGAKIRREGERDIRRDTERRVRVVREREREREIKGEREREGAWSERSAKEATAGPLWNFSGLPWRPSEKKSETPTAGSCMCEAHREINAA